MTMQSGAGAATPAPDVAGGSPTAPLRIHADRAAGTVAIDWADGHHTIYEATPLRWLCPCAFCRGEAGVPGWLDSKPTLSEAQTQLTDMQLVGQYAGQVVRPRGEGGEYCGDDSTDQDAGQDANREGGQRPSGERNPE